MTTSHPAGGVLDACYASGEAAEMEKSAGAKSKRLCALSRTRGFRHPASKIRRMTEVLCEMVHIRSHYEDPHAVGGSP
jgi:hypothetical protein